MWTGVGKGEERAAEQSNNLVPDGLVTDFACRLHPPTLVPPSLPNSPPSPLAWLLSRDSLGSWCACPHRRRSPAGALTDESLLPPWGQAREGVEGGLDSGF